MKKILVLLFALPFLGGATCIKAGPVGPVPPADAGFVDCSEAALHQGALNILPDVTSDVGLATSASAAALEALGLTLAAQVGGTLAIDEIGCAIQWVISKAQRQVATTSDSTAAIQVANAKAWQAKHPMSFAGSP